MRKKKLIFVVILAIAAVYLSYSISQKKKRIEAEKKAAAAAAAAEKKETVNKTKKVKAVVLTKKMKIGYMITQADVEIKDIDAENVPKDHFKKTDTLIGRFVVDESSAGTPVTEQMLFEKGLRPSLALYVPKGKRAVNIQISKDACLGGFLRQNDHVDILGIFSDKVSDEPFVKLLASDAEILTINKEFLIPGRPVEIDKKDPKSQKKNVQSGKISSEKIVTSAVIVVSAEEAERIVLASELAKIYFMLRSPFEEDQEYILPFNKYDLVDMKRADKIIVQKQEMDIIKNEHAAKKNAQETIRSAIEVYKGAVLELVPTAQASTTGSDQTGKGEK